MKVFFLVFLLASCLCRAQHFASPPSFTLTPFNSSWTLNGRPMKTHNSFLPDVYTAADSSLHPYIGRNELLWQDKDTEMVYGINFDLPENPPASRAELVLRGLDTYASVYFNDSLLISASNAFRTWRAEISNLLRKKNNVLRIKIFPAPDSAKKLAAQLPYRLPEGERVFVRKPQYRFGWDFAPRLSAGGLTGPLEICFFNNLRSFGCAARTLSMTKDSAVLELGWTVAALKAGQYGLQLELNGNGTSLKKEYVMHLETGMNNITKKLTIKKPALWWCSGYGPAHLYECRLLLTQNKQPAAGISFYTGIRTLELEQEKDFAGSSFAFRLNGKRIFIKGANYVPGEQEAQLVQEAKEAGMNMLRVWGGGNYPSDSFLDECDRQGILVWQDFMFACAMYPGNEQFLSNVEAEITEQVQRIRHHPCLALWCGNNEADEGWRNWGWQRQYSYSAADSEKIYAGYKKLFHGLIPEVLAAYDPGRPYWPSSPSIGWGHAGSLLQGDAHYWGVWWGMEPFEAYEKKTGRFMSEYGFQSFPSPFAWKRCCGDSLNLSSPCIVQHQKHPRGFETIHEYLQRDYKIPAAPEDYIYTSQLLQANGMKTAIEAHRRAKPYCMGTLFWQLNDCWPAVSWSSIDYYGNRKAAYYYAKRAYKTFLLSFSSGRSNIRLHVVSDTLAEMKVRLEVSLVNFAEGKTWKKDTLLQIGANAAFIAFTLPSLPPFDSSFTLLHAELKNMEQRPLAEASYFFKRPKDLRLPVPAYEIAPAGKNSYSLRAHVFIKDLWLHTQKGELKADDNFFDLLPGEEKIITLGGQKFLPAELEWKCLNEIK